MTCYIALAVDGFSWGRARVSEDLVLPSVRPPTCLRGRSSKNRLRSKHPLFTLISQDFSYPARIFHTASERSSHWHAPARTPREATPELSGSQEVARGNFFVQASFSSSAPTSSSSSHSSSPPSPSSYPSSPSSSLSSPLPSLSPPEGS